MKTVKKLKSIPATAAPLSDLLSPLEAAAALGVAPQTLAMWRSVRRCGPRYLKLGRRVKYRASDIEAFKASSTIDPAA